MGRAGTLLDRRGLPPPATRGRPHADREAGLGPLVVWATLKNPAFKGTAGFGKTHAGPPKPQRLRPLRGRPDHPRRPASRVDTPPEDQIFISVHGLVSEEL